jgi:hypothetical protein
MATPHRCTNSGIRLSGYAEALLSAVHRALADHGQEAPDDLQLPPGCRVVPKKVVADLFAQALDKGHGFRFNFDPEKRYASKSGAARAARAAGLEAFECLRDEDGWFFCAPAKRPKRLGAALRRSADVLIQQRIIMRDGVLRPGFETTDCAYSGGQG